jgi:hypothetical protein
MNQRVAGKCEILEEPPMTKNSAEPPLSEDLLEGAAAIAAFIFGDAGKRRRVYQLAEDGRGEDKLPVFRLGDTLCARRSTLQQWIADRERGQMPKVDATRNAG